MFATFTDAIASVAAAIDASDPGLSEHYDTVAIAGEAFRCITVPGAAGFEQHVTEPEFWRIVERHAL